MDGVNTCGLLKTLCDAVWFVSSGQGWYLFNKRALNRQD
jgi:hypothetical protein